MRTLSATLLAAQQSASASPYMRVRLLDRDVGTVRLRWARWYSGGEPPGPCGAATPADGSLLRARIVESSGALSHQRVAAPSPSSDYGTWTSLGTVAATPRLGLAAAGTRALLATVRTDGVTVEVRESTDSGASFGASSVAATSGAAVSAVTCALQSDGSAAVLYAAGGVVYAVTRSGVGAWGTPQAWSPSLTAVSAVAAYFETDYNVLVSGVTSAGDEGAWATVLGAGGARPPGNWASLAEVALASAGTDVTYLATGVAVAGVPRALLVESYSGGGAYDRVHMAGGVAFSLYPDFLWREPRPFDHASPHGLAVAAGNADAWLAAADGVWHAPITVPIAELTDDVLEADLEQGLDGGRLRLVLRNDDGRYNTANAPAALAPGGELLTGAGYRTDAGDESSEGPRFWIRSVGRRRRGGSATVELEAVDGWGLLRAWTAPRQLVWPAGTLNAFQLVQQLVRHAGINVFSSGLSAEATALQPAFTARPGERGSTAVSRLLATLPDVLLMSGVGAALTEPLPDDAPGYSYGVAHPVTALRVDEGRPAAGWARVFGSGVFAQSVDEDALLGGAGTAIEVDDNLTDQARAGARAATLLRHDALEVPRGELVAAPNAGQEVGDVIEVTDPALGLDGARFRVGALRLRFARGGARPVYEMRLSLTGV